MDPDLVSDPHHWELGSEIRENLFRIPDKHPGVKKHWIRIRNT
jgi:hypothetical protein